jgi:hypothetical protein
MTGLEAERLNVAARGLGVARAAFEEAIKYAQQRQTFGKPIASHQTIQIKLADMATRIEASRLLIYSAAAKKDRRERCDLEAGMAKLFATETAADVSLEDFPGAWNLPPGAGRAFHGLSDSMESSRCAHISSPPEIPRWTGGAEWTGRTSGHDRARY